MKVSNVLLEGNSAKLRECLQTYFIPRAAQAEAQVRVNTLLVPLGSVLNFPWKLWTCLLVTSCSA